MTETAFRFVIPGKTVSGANSREHYMAKAKRVKAERQRTAIAVLVAGARGLLARGAAADRIIVTLTRISPRALDEGDNLPSALKATRDELARLMDIDDRDERCAWVYAQRKGEPKQHAIDVEVSLGGGVRD